MPATTKLAPSTSVIDWFWICLPYGLLAVTLVIHAVQQPSTAGPAEVARPLVIAVGIAGWHWWWAVRGRRRPGQSTGPMVVYYLGMLIAALALCAISFTFFPVYLACFALAFVALPGAWAYLGVAVTALVAFAPPWLLTPSFSNLGSIVGGGLLAAGAGWSIRALEVSQRRLQDALAENHHLQDQLIDDAREAGTAAERARLGAELHDTIAADMTGMVSQLEAIDAEFELPEGAHHRVRTALEAARGCLDEVRGTVSALRPAALTGRSLAGGLTMVTAAFQRTRRIPVELQTTGTEIEVPDNVAHALLRTAQEALTNVAKHAGADRAHVTLSYLQDCVALDIADDGEGLPQRNQGTGQGLTIMRERLVPLGGRLDVASEPGGGTTVTATVPLTDGETALGTPRQGKVTDATR